MFRSSPFPGLVRRAELSFVATLTLESEPIKVEDSNDKDLKVFARASVSVVDGYRTKWL